MTKGEVVGWRMHLYQQSQNWEEPWGVLNVCGSMCGETLANPPRPQNLLVTGCGFNRCGASVSIILIFETCFVPTIMLGLCRFYASLGATAEFHDDLIIFAYQRQIYVDPNNTPYYLECLQGLGEGRKSEDLQTQAAIEASSGNISLKDIRAAYKDLGLDFNQHLLDDDTIIGNFQARVSDAPRQEPELRRALQIIGQSRSSEKIQSMASKGNFQ